MPSESQIRELFWQASPGVIDLMLTMRRHLKTYLPEHDENFRWNLLVFDKPNLKATVLDNICTFRPVKQSVEVALRIGVLLNDPDRLLKGNHRYKRVLILDSIEAFEDERIRELILQSYHFKRDEPLYRKLPTDGTYEELKRMI